jgi:lysozyme
MDTPASLLALIRRFEGLRLKAYYCPAGVLTCGYGSTGPDIKPDTVWTKEEAEARMLSDAALFTSAAKKLCPGQSGDNLAALADFAYNLGATRLAGSTLRRKINAGDLQGAKVELRKWVRAGGRILPGLVLRREAEGALLR